MYDRTSEKAVTGLADLLSDFKKKKPEAIYKIIEKVSTQISKDESLSLILNSTEFTKLANLILENCGHFSREQINAIMKFKECFVDVLIQIHLAEMTELNSELNSIREGQFYSAVAPIHAACNSINTFDSSKKLNEQSRYTALCNVFNDLQIAISNLKLLLMQYINEIIDLDKCKNPFILAANFPKIKEIKAKVLRCRQGLQLYEQAVELSKCIETKLDANPSTFNEYQEFLKKYLTKENCTAIQKFDVEYEDGFWKKWQNKLCELESSFMNDFFDSFDFDNITD